MTLEAASSPRIATAPVRAAAAASRRVERDSRRIAVLSRQRRRFVRTSGQPGWNFRKRLHLCREMSSKSHRFCCLSEDWPSETFPEMIQLSVMARAANVDEYRRSKVTIREIADLAGVSIATVSRVVNARGDVAPETRELVTRVIQEQGYTTNRSARALSGGRTSLVGWAMPLVLQRLLRCDPRRGAGGNVRAGDASSSSARRSTSTTARSRSSSSSPTARQTAASSCFRRSRTRSSWRFRTADSRSSSPTRACPSPRAFRPCRRRTAPVRRRRPTTCSRSDTDASVTLWDDQGGSRPRSGSSGYHAALAAAGVLPSDELVVEGDFERSSGFAAANELLDLPDPPTAVFAANDNMAIGVLQAARERGISVPEDLSVVGFDDSEAAGVVTPTLTTVRQPLAELGRTAVSLLMRMIERQRLEALRVELATRLVIRGSAAPPPARG